MNSVFVVNDLGNWRPVTGVDRPPIVVNTDVAQLADLDDRTRRVIVGVCAAAVTVTFDGTDPVANVNGMEFPRYSVFNISRAMARALRVVRSTGTNARLSVLECEFDNNARG